MNHMPEVTPLEPIGPMEKDRACPEKSVWDNFYLELRRIAHLRLQQEWRNHTLSTTGLVHEAYLRLNGNATALFADSEKVFFYISRTMRQILVDLARKRKAKKRNNGRPVLSLADDLVSASGDIGESVDLDLLLDIDKSLKTLEVLNGLWAQVVEYKFFGGLKEDEIAEIMGVSTRTVERYWKHARAWLYNHLRQPAE